MTLTTDKKILIIGLGVMGGSYARALTKQGFSIRCITKDEADIAYALKEKIIAEGLPGGLAVKNPPANTGDTGLIPGLRRSHMQRATEPIHHNY